MSVAVTDEFLDDEWLSAPRRRSRLRPALALALAAALFFLGGVLVQKHFGAEEPAAASAFPTGAGDLPAGMPQGMEGMPDGAVPQGTESEPDPESSNEESQSVIGKLIRRQGSTWIVEDLGGTRYRIAVADDAEVVRELQIDAEDIKPGDTVSVTGDKGQGNALTATEVIVR